MADRKTPLGIRVIAIYFGALFLVLAYYCILDVTKAHQTEMPPTKYALLGWCIIAFILAVKDHIALLYAVIIGGVLIAADLYFIFQTAKTAPVGSGNYVIFWTVVRIVVYYSLLDYVFKDHRKRRQVVYSDVFE